MAVDENEIIGTGIRTMLADSLKNSKDPGHIVMFGQPVAGLAESGVPIHS
ncbi:MAG: hypothetical protein JO189_23695 [Deltaproteobacteria bacterium]|nr:hypothetical protein [Deltaproteobacteria bacterium]